MAGARLRSRRPRVAAGLLVAVAALGHAAAALYIYGEPAGAPWASPSLQHPLGLDEFGRDLLATAYLSAGNSLMYGLACALVALTAAAAIGYPVAFMRSRWLALAIDATSRVVESLPVVVWVLLLTMLAPAASRAISTVAFLVAVLPYLSRVVAGEFARLAGAPFVETARMQELPRRTLVARHLLPNAVGVLGPALAQVCGLAIAINGAVAIVGSAQRTQLTIGTLLLRGKENALTHPRLAVVAVLVLLGVFVLIWLAARRVGGELRSDGRWL